MQKYKKLRARILSLALTAAMVFTTMPATVFATEGNAALGASGITECHVEHDKDCGYVVAVEGTPCSHKNDDGTYSCASVSGNTATPGDADKSDCTHEDDCGYVEAVEGADCTHSCEICKPLDSGSADKQPAQEQCSCGVLCTEDKINADCTVCAADGADLTNCKGEDDKNAAVKHTYEQVVDLFTALPAASTINRTTTAEEKDAIIAQLTEAMDALEALTADEQALFMKEQTALYKAAMALNDVITGATPKPMADVELPPFAEGTNKRYKSGETVVVDQLKIGDRVEVGVTINPRAGNSMENIYFDSYELYCTGGLGYESGPMGEDIAPATLTDHYANTNNFFADDLPVTTRTEWILYADLDSDLGYYTFVSPDLMVKTEYDVTVAKSGLTGATAQFDIVLNSANKPCVGNSFKVADFDKLLVTLTPDSGNTFATAPTVASTNTTTVGTPVKQADGSYTCEIATFTGNPTITVAGTAGSASTSVDKTALTSAITAATTNKDSVETSTDGKDVDPSKKWVTAAVKTAYNDAITAAQTVADKTSATQAEIDAAVTALAAATTTFNNAKADGTKPAPVTKYAITFTNPANGTLTATVDGSAITTGTEVATGKIVTFTVTPNSGYEVDTWSGATAGTPNTTATLTVSAAVTVSVTLKAIPTDKTALTTAITAATTNKDSVETSTDGKDVDPSKKWVTAAVKTAYNNAITAAQTVANKTGATQAEIDAAVTALAAATTTFNNAKADGTKPAPVTKYAITFANPTNGTLAATVDGSTITSGTEVESGKTVTFTVTPNSGYEVDTWSGATAGTPNTKATLTVSAAATVSVTLKATPADKTALTTAITAATTNKDSVETSTDGKDVDTSKKWVTAAVKTAYNNAITAAQTVANKTGATQAEIDAAVTALATATTTFNNAKADGTKPAPVTKYAITFANPTNGTLTATVDGSAITTGTEVATGKIVTFTVTPNSGYEVNAWSGATAGTPNTTATLTVSAAVTVSVTLKSTTSPVTKYAITFANPTNGTLAATVDGSTITSGTEVAAGKTVTFTVTPNSGYEVDTWSGATAGTPNTTATLTVSAAATVSVSLKAVSETDQQIADRVAALITSITAPDKDATTLTLPTVSDGCTIAIKSSSNEAVISLNGTITPPDAETEVTLVLTVTKGSATADTISIKVKVPAKSTAIPDKSALNAAIASAKSIMANTVISVQNGSDVSPSSYWVLPDIMSAAKTALSEAEAVLANPNATQAEIANAAVKLNAKVNIDFKNAKKPGTKSNSSSDSGSSSGGGGSSSSGNTPSIVPPNTTQPTQPNPPTTVETKVPATVDNKGNATVNVTDKTMQDAIDKAVSEAKKNGTSGNGISVVISVTTDGKNANTVTVNLPKTVQEKVIAGKVLNTVVVVDRPDISINMNLATITEINKQAKSDVQLSATRMDNTKLSGDAKTAIGNRPTFDLKATYASGSKAISNFGTGSVTLGIPYTLQAGEVASGLYAVYVDGNGKVTYLTNSSYDANAKLLRFSTNHFSVYGIGYKAPTGFTDIANHWAKSDIEFVVNRGLFSGTSATTFSPDGAMTRGMFVTALGRLAGIDVNAYKTNKFTDVKADAYYAPYANWAASKGITNGTTATTFAPDTAISRQEMAVMMSNYAKALGYTVPQTRAANTFADNANIASWAADAVKQMQMAGILNGKNSNKFDPTGTATRGEISAMLRRYVELVIDRVTTEGWTTNDSGSGMYYQNGKALVGAQTIAGVAYTFNTYGEATGKTTTAGATTTNPALPTESKKYTLYTVKKNDWISKIALAHNCTVEEILALNNITNKDLIYEGQQIKIPQK